MYERFFLEGASLTKFNVFRYLKERSAHSITVAQVAKAMVSSYSKAQHAVSAMLEDLNTINTQRRAAPVADSSDFREIARDITTEDYRFFLLQSSPTFLFYDQIFQGETVNIGDFAKTQGISVSTMRRKIEPFREYLVSQGVVLDIRSWTITGSEPAVRIFLEAIYTDLYDGKTWPLRRVSAADVEHCCSELQGYHQRTHTEETSFVTNRERIILGIQLMRVECGHYYTPGAAYASIHENRFLDNPVFTPTNFPELTSRQLAAESKYLLFNTLARVNYAVQNTQKQQQIRKFFDSTDNPITRLVHGVISAVQAQLPPMARAYLASSANMITNLYRIAYTYYIVGGRFTTANRFDEATAAELSARAPLLDAITNNVENIPTRDPAHGFVRHLPQLANSLLTEMLPVLNEYDPQPLVRVRLELEFIDTDIIDLMHLLTVTGVISVLPDSSPAEADIIITASTSIDPMLAEMTGDFSAAEQLRSRGRRESVLYWNPEHDDTEMLALRQRISEIAAVKYKESQHAG